MKEPFVTVFTATYNRAKTLPDLYECICAQDYKNFEWIIVDDGSEDNTGELVNTWISEDKVNIRYFYQENNGKHIAMNLGLKEAKGKYFVNIDSDDKMEYNSIGCMVDAWQSILSEDFEKYMSVKFRCYNPYDGSVVGGDMPAEKLSCSILDAKYKYKINFEMWSMVRTDVRLQYLNPDIRGGKRNGGLRFFPEGIWQDNASRKYLTLFVDKPLRAYTQDTSTSLMGYGAKYDRSRENIYLWTHIVNDNLDYFKYDPKSFIKAFIGVSMDSFFLKYGLKKCLQCVNGFFRKSIVFICMPIGFLCYLKKR